MNTLMQSLSLLGAGMILGAFFALQRRLCASDHPAYLWANLIGSTFLAVVAVWNRSYGFILLECAWAIVSIASIVGARRAPPA